MAKKPKAEVVAQPTETEAVELKSVPVVEIPADQVVVKVDDASAIGRYKVVSDDKVAELAYDIVQRGQLQPIQVVREGDKFTPVFGNTRALAIQLANKGFSFNGKNYCVALPIQAQIVDETDAKKLKLNTYAENAKRNSYTAMDFCNAIHDLMDNHGLKGKAIAEFFGWTDKAIASRYASLNKLPGSVQDLLHDGKLKLTHGYEFSKESNGLTEEDMLALAGEEELTLARINDYVRDKRKAEKGTNAEGGDSEGGDSEGGDSEGGDSEETTESTGKARTLKQLMACMEQYTTKGSNNSCKQIQIITGTFLAFAAGAIDADEVESKIHKIAKALRKQTGEQSTEEKEADAAPGSM